MRQWSVENVYQTENEENKDNKIISLSKNLFHEDGSVNCEYLKGKLFLQLLRIMWKNEIHQITCIYTTSAVLQ